MNFEGIEIAALWPTKNKKGFSGPLKLDAIEEAKEKFGKNVRVLVLPNDYKKDKQPHHRIFAVSGEPQEKTREPEGPLKAADDLPF